MEWSSPLSAFTLSFEVLTEVEWEANLIEILHGEIAVCTVRAEKSLELAKTVVKNSGDASPRYLD